MNEIRFYINLTKQFITEQKLNELEVRVGGYAGRDLAIPGKTILWQYIKVPRPAGLLLTFSDGTTTLNGKDIGNIDYPIQKLTHKKQIAEFFDELKLERYREKSGLEFRDFIEDMYEKNVRGRILNSGSGWVVYVWNYNTPQYMIDKAVDSIYKYIPKEYI